MTKWWCREHTCAQWARSSRWKACQWQLCPWSSPGRASCSVPSASHREYCCTRHRVSRYSKMPGLVTNTILFPSLTSTHIASGPSILNRKTFVLVAIPEWRRLSGAHIARIQYPFRSRNRRISRCRTVRIRACRGILWSGRIEITIIVLFSKF